MHQARSRFSRLPTSPLALSSALTAPPRRSRWIARLALVVVCCAVGSANAAPAPFATTPADAEGAVWLNFEAMETAPILAPVRGALAGETIGAAAVDAILRGISPMLDLGISNPRAVEMSASWTGMSPSDAQNWALVIHADFDREALGQKFAAAGFSESGGQWHGADVWIAHLVGDDRLLMSRGARLATAMPMVAEGNEPNARSRTDQAGHWITSLSDTSLFAGYYSLSAEAADALATGAEQMAAGSSGVPGLDAMIRAQRSLRVAGFRAPEPDAKALRVLVDLLYEEQNDAQLTVAGLTSAIAMAKMSMMSAGANDPSAAQMLDVINRIRVLESTDFASAVVINASSTADEIESGAAILPIMLMSNRQARAREIANGPTHKIQADLKRIDDANQEYAIQYNLDAGDPYPAIEDLVALGYLRRLPTPPEGDPYVQAQRVLGPADISDPAKLLMGYPSWPGGTPDNGRVHPDFLPWDDAGLDYGSSYAAPDYEQMESGDPTTQIQADLMRIDWANQEYAIQYNLDAGDPFPSIEDLTALGYLRTVPTPPDGGHYVQAERVPALDNVLDPSAYPSWPGGTQENQRIHPDLLDDASGWVESASQGEWQPYAETPPSKGEPADTRSIQADLKRIDDANQEYAIQYNLDAGDPYPALVDLANLGYLRRVPVPPGGGSYEQAREVIFPADYGDPEKMMLGYPSWPGGTPENGRVHPDLLP